MELFLDAKGKRRFVGSHPWVSDRSIVTPVGQPVPGQIVELVTAGGGWIGRGVYNPNSRIRVRLYQWQRDATLDEQWLESQLEKAVQLRKLWMSRNGKLDAVRWVNSEGDGVSGLVVDQFGDYLMVHLHAMAMSQWEKCLVQWLGAQLSPKAICVRVDGATAKAEGIEPRQDWVFGNPPESPIEIQESGIRLQLDLAKGQKTGYYLDQRSNRIRAAGWMSDGPLLDVCCYLGGFSLAAHRIAGTRSITAVDSSLSVLEQAEANARLNAADIDFVQADSFDFLKSLEASTQRFSTVVLDPPKMASNRGQVSAALRAYYRLNLSAVNLLERGGILVTCSCSGRVARTDFVGILGSVAHRTKRSIQIIESLGADFDHPVQAQCPEGEYLKCLICRVH